MVYGDCRLSTRSYAVINTSEVLNESALNLRLTLENVIINAII